MANYIVYHQRDLDGKCSGAIARKALRERGEEATLIPMDYGWEFPDKLEHVGSKDGVFIVDFSFEDDEIMSALNEQANLVWIDHHSRRVKELENIGFRAQKQNTAHGVPAAAALTWRFFYPDESAPLAVQLVSMYDAWQETPEWDTAVLPFQIGMQLYGNSPGDGIWTRLLSIQPHWNTTKAAQDIIEQGRVATKYRTALRERLLNDAIPLVWTIDGEMYSCLTVNAEVRGDFWDELEQRGFINKSDYDLLIGYHYDGEPGWRVSLEPGEPDMLDAGAVAKKFDGGGHPGRAGFTCEWPVFLENNK